MRELDEEVSGSLFPEWVATFTGIRIFGLFAPALFLPVVCVMYVKVEYFPDRLYPPVGELLYPAVGLL